MEREEVLSAALQRVVAVSNPERVILFGSRARGGARRHSDYDLLVIQPSFLPRYRRSGAIYGALADLPAEFDVVVYTPEEVQEWRNVPQAFVTTAIREGTVLYERES